jgi:L-threonylcarbamoyladenylate synthase
LLTTRYFDTTDKDLREAAAVIAAGGLVCFPTETVYGLGADAMNPNAARDTYAAKGRPSDNPLIVHISRFEDLEVLAAEVPPVAKTLAEAFWPGPLTMVFHKRPEVPEATTGGLDTVAVRLPDSEPTLKLIEYAGTPVSGPSANLSGHPSPTSWQHCRDDLDGKVDGIIMGDPCRGGIESTVLSLTDKVLTVLRPGLVTPEMISEATGQPCVYDPAILGRPDPAMRPKAPGMKYKHYAPKAEMVLYSGSAENVRAAIDAEAERQRSAGKKVSVLLYGGEDTRLVARDFFAKLRAADDENVDLILAAALPAGEELAFSVMNRMLKAAGYTVIEV